MKTSRIKVTDACQSLIGTFSTLRRCVVFGRMLQGQPVRVVDFWIKRVRDSDLQTDSDAGVSRRANEGVYVTFDQNCNIRPEDEYRRKIKLSPKTTG